MNRISQEIRPCVSVLLVFSLILHVGDALSSSDSEEGALLAIQVSMLMIVVCASGFSFAHVLFWPGFEDVGIRKSYFQYC
jgi:hypothetical protein